MHLCYYAKKSQLTFVYHAYITKLDKSLVFSRSEYKV